MAKRKNVRASRLNATAETIGAGQALLARLGHTVEVRGAKAFKKTRRAAKNAAKTRKPAPGGESQIAVSNHP